MARVDYWDIEQGIRTQLTGDATLAGVTVLVEEELSWQRGDIVGIYLLRREAPPDLQSLSAGTRTRFNVVLSLWCFHFAITMSDAIQKRDDLLGKVEIALMKDPTLQGKVNASWLDGGEFQTGQPSGKGGPGWLSGGEIRLVAEVVGTT